MKTVSEKWTLGLMSGTSMDGIDVAALRTDGQTIFEYGPTACFPYQKSFKERLSAILGSTERTLTINSISLELTDLHRKAVLDFLDRYSLSEQDIDLIGFHGHTILHQSPKRHPKGRTWQIGQGQKLANELHIPVVADLRSNDILQGGEGAPLVPIFHQAFGKHFEKPFVILNIGGIANITYGDEGVLYAFDTGPGNGLLDRWIQQLTGQDYDVDGLVARKGIVDKELVNQWLQDPYFLISPPKSLDRLDLNYFPKEHSLENGAATLLAFTVCSIVQGLKRCPASPKTIIVTGGGRHNTALMEALKKAVSPIPLETMEDRGLSSDFIEAQAFAYLAKRSFHGLPLTFPTTTGCQKPLTGGTLYTPC